MFLFGFQDAFVPFWCEDRRNFADDVVFVRFVCMCAGYGAPAETPADKQGSAKSSLGMFEQMSDFVIVDTVRWSFCFLLGFLCQR